MEKKGTVRRISSLFPAEETQKASKLVQDTIFERQQQLHQLRGFIDDNINLINLVQRLPEETHHNIMVPFGKAAFFPGRMIHTNEFMVLLGEGYYAERTSRQTVEILKRRGKNLENQVESLKAIMEDLNVEASFFDATAHESAEGLVEIIEDYVEEDNSESSAMAGNKTSDSTIVHKLDDKNVTPEVEEYNRIFARMSELEMEEEEAEKAEKSSEDEQMKKDPDWSIDHVSIDQNVKASEVPTKISNDAALRVNYQTPNPSIMNKTQDLPAKEEVQVQAPFATNNTAFTGSILERTHNIGMETSEQQMNAHKSKPVSRFKMQRK